MSETFKKALRHSMTLNEDTPVGKIVLEGEDLYVMISEYDTIKAEESMPESHRKYADVQIIIAGREQIHYYLDFLPIETDYDSNRDIAFHKDKGETPAVLEMKPGYFALFLPDELHKPRITSGIKSERVKKAVYKIAHNKLEPEF